jgi:S-(hydroxymethyl)glutathione dehydrogenase/alcohol dehydrogenase
MRAAVLYEVGRDLEVDEVELSGPGPGQVRVALAASGVCHSDLSLMDGTLPASLPSVLGHEGAGVVTEVGPQVEHVAPGDHVVISWIGPCRRCHFCLSGQPVLCEHGMDHVFAGPYGTWRGQPVSAGLGTATFAEETVVPEACAVRIDPKFPLGLACLVGCGVVTGVGAVLNAARVRPGSSVAVVGCGGVGLAALQGARMSGASPIIAVDRVPAKLEMARRHGATDTVLAEEDPVAAVMELTGRGVDYAFEVVGSSRTIAQAYAMARRGGTVTVVGAGRLDDPVSLGALGLMLDAKVVQGCVYGSTDPQRDFPRMLELARAGLLDLEALVTRRIRLEDVNSAFRAMQAGEVARSVIELG